MRRAVRKLDKHELETMEMLSDWVTAQSEPLPSELRARAKNFFDDIGYANLRIEEDLECI